MIKEFWESLGSRPRAGFIAGIAAIVCATAVAAAWLLHTDYQVLFADLKPQDTAAMVAELDRMKVPYRIAGDGNTLLVDAKVVHATRLKLMGKDMPLHGAAGFEIFNNADFGMTEFAQKINYQRALQGEITRTILSLAEVRDVRVHLALPEDGLFKKVTAKPTAAITLAVKEGQSLRPEQVTGIQRLVSAAVPGIAAQDVTIIDQQGVALTRPASADADRDTGSARLDLKRDTEKLLSHKATEVLERAVGAGQVLASVDVTLNMDQVRVTTEDVLGGPPRAGQAAAGVIVRERDSDHDAGPPLGGRGETSRGSSQREVEYQVGRRVEQVATQPGSIRRLNVVAVVRQPLDTNQLDQMRSLVSAAVGAMPERGDTVVVQSLATFHPATEPAVAELNGGDDAAPARKPAHSLPASRPSALFDGGNAPWVITAALLASALLASLVWMRRRSVPRVKALTSRDREALLEQMRGWLDGEGDNLARRPSALLGRGGA